MRPANRKDRTRRKLERDVAAFKARGGRIQQIPSGVSVPTRTWVLSPEAQEKLHGEA